MHSNAASPIVSIRFGNLDTFCEELAARGPNIEPVVRICQQVRRGHSEDLGPSETAQGTACLNCSGMPHRAARPRFQVESMF